MRVFSGQFISGRRRRNNLVELYYIWTFIPDGKLAIKVPFTSLKRYGDIFDLSFDSHKRYSQPN